MGVRATQLAVSAGVCVGLVLLAAWLLEMPLEKAALLAPIIVASVGAAADFAYRDPRGDRALLELAPVPSWHELQFRR